MGDVVVGTKLIRNFLLRELALRRWLEQVLIEDLSSSNDSSTLWEKLKDGVLLCRVMLTLKPNSVPKIHEEKAVFRRKENLFFFLEALDEHDFPSKKKFTVADLYEEKNLVKVLECMEELAKIAVLEWNFYFRLKTAGEIEEELGMSESKFFTDADKTRASRILTSHLQETNKRAQRNFSSAYIPATKRIVTSAKTKLAQRDAASTYGAGVGAIVAASLNATSSGAAVAITTGLDSDGSSLSSSASASTNIAIIDDMSNNNSYNGILGGSGSLFSVTFKVETEPASPHAKALPGSGVVALPSPRSQAAPSPPSQDLATSSTSTAGALLEAAAVVDNINNDDDYGDGDEVSAAVVAMTRPTRRNTVVSIVDDREAYRAAKGKEKAVPYLPTFASADAALEIAMSAADGQDDSPVAPIDTSRSVIVVPLSPQEEEVLLRGMIRLQALLRGKMARVKYRKKLRNAAYRESVAREIEKTEQDYVDNLRLLSEVYLEPLRKELENKEEALEGFKGVFADIQVIRNYNGKMLNDIKPRVAHWHPNQSLGDIFLQVAAFLKAYTQYVTKYNKAIAHITSLKKQMPKFRQFLEECAEKANGQDITALLIQPVQRIPRYQLLLKDLITHSDPEHLDYEALDKAAEKIREVAVYIEKRCEEAENITKVSEIQSRLFGKIDNLAQASRKYVRQGEMVVWSLENKKKENRVVILFNDLLLETKPMVKKGRKGEPDLQVLKYLHSWNLYHVSPSAMPDTERDKFGLALTAEGGKTALVRLYAKSAFERDDWVRAFQALRDDIEAKRHEHYERVRDAAQSKAARYKETIEGRYTSPNLPAEESTIAPGSTTTTTRTSTVSSRWESRLRAHAARIRQIQATQAGGGAVDGNGDPSLSLPLPPRSPLHASDGDTNSVGGVGSLQSGASSSVYPASPELGHHDGPDAAEGGGGGDGGGDGDGASGKGGSGKQQAGRHTITEGMVKSESPSLFSRLFLRKRAKTRSPIPHYASSSVRSLKPHLSAADVTPPDAGAGSSSTSSTGTAESTLTSSASCADCVPSPRHKARRESYLREEKKSDDKDERSGRTRRPREPKRGSKSSIGKTTEKGERKRRSRSLSTSSSSGRAASELLSSSSSSTSSRGTTTTTTTATNQGLASSTSEVQRVTRRRPGSSASADDERAGTDSSPDKMAPAAAEGKGKEKRRSKRKSKDKDKDKDRPDSLQQPQPQQQSPPQPVAAGEPGAGGEEEAAAAAAASPETPKRKLSRKHSAQRIKEAIIQTGSSQSSLFQRIVTASPTVPRSGGSSIRRSPSPPRGDNTSRRPSDEPPTTSPSPSDGAGESGSAPAQPQQAELAKAASESGEPRRQEENEEEDEEEHHHHQQQQAKEAEPEVIEQQPAPVEDETPKPDGNGSDGHNAAEAKQEETPAAAGEDTANGGHERVAADAEPVGPHHDPPRQEEEENKKGHDDNGLHHHYHEEDEDDDDEKKSRDQEPSSNGSGIVMSNGGGTPHGACDGAEKPQEEAAAPTAPAAGEWKKGETGASTPAHPGGGGSGIGGMTGKRVNSELRLDTTSSATFTKEVRQRELGHLRSIRMHSFRSTRSKWEQKQTDIAAAAAAGPSSGAAVAADRKMRRSRIMSKPEDQVIAPTNVSSGGSSTDSSRSSSPTSSSPSSPRS